MAAEIPIARVIKVQSTGSIDHGLDLSIVFGFGGFGDFGRSSRSLGGVDELFD